MPLSFVGIYTVAAFIPTVIEAPLNAFDRIASAKISFAWIAGDRKQIFDIYYKPFRSLINNRTSVIEGTGYLPVDKLIDFFNRPIEVTYNNDTYVIIGINTYNPITETGKFKIIKKVTYQNLN